jgi:hypothetical protein
VVTETFRLGFGSLFLEAIRLCSWVKKGEHAAYFSIDIVRVVSALLLFENTPVKLITIIDFTVPAKLYTDSE